MNDVSRAMSFNRAGLWSAVCLTVALGGEARAQETALPAQGAESLVAIDPIRCWWRTGKSAVYIGEHLLLTLTCSVVETADVRVVADQARLDPAAVQLQPFDIVEGMRHPDIQAGQRRLFQYEYVVRVIADDLFGSVVPIPPVDVHYRVLSDVEATDTIEGLERVYQLPALPITVMTLASLQAVDIRDTTSGTFSAIQSLRFRGNVAFALAALLFSVGLGFVAVAASSAMRRYRTPSDEMPRLLSDADVLGGAIRELERVQGDVLREGWSLPAIGMALAAVRLGIAIALGRRPAQVVLDPADPGQDGAVIVRSGVIQPRRVMVSASVTADAFGPAGGDAEGLRSVLRVLTVARYGRRDDLPREDLDRAVDEGLTVLGRLRTERSWPKTVSDALHGAVAMRWRRVP
jgi:hypothetical protein